MYFFAVEVEAHWGRWPGNPSALDWAVFVALSLTSAFLVLYLGYLGEVLLIGRCAAALWQVCLVFVLEIGYFWADTLVTWNLGMIFRPPHKRRLLGYSYGPTCAPSDHWVPHHRAHCCHHANFLATAICKGEANCRRMMAR